MTSDNSEEMFLYVEFENLHDTAFLKSQPIRIMDLESDQPVVQLGNQTFAGEYEDVLGTAMFFQKSEQLKKTDPLFSKAPKQQLEYIGKTGKKLTFKRVFLAKKTTPNGQTGVEPSDFPNVDEVNASILNPPLDESVFGFSGSNANVSEPMQM